MDSEPRGLKASEVYNYQTRPGDETSTLKILLIEGDTVHIEIRKVNFLMKDGPRTAIIAHLPIHREHLEGSLLGAPSCVEPIGENWIEGYNQFKSGPGTHFMNSVAQALNHMQATFTEGTVIVDEEEPPANPMSYEAVKYRLVREPMTEAMKIYIHCNLPPNDSRNPDLDSLNCWSGLGGIWKFAGIEQRWGYQEFVASTLVDMMGVDQAIAAVLSKEAKDLVETARDFFKEAPQPPKAPTLGGMMSDFMDPRADAKFSRILDALQGLYRLVGSKDGAGAAPYNFAAQVLKECGRG